MLRLPRHVINYRLGFEHWCQSPLDVLCRVLGWVPEHALPPGIQDSKNFRLALRITVTEGNRMEPFPKPSNHSLVRGYGQCFIHAKRTLYPISNPLFAATRAKWGLEV